MMKRIPVKISAGSPKRPRGTMPSIFSSISGRIPSRMGVRTNPGAMAPVRRPWRASSLRFVVNQVNSAAIYVTKYAVDVHCTPALLLHPDTPEHVTKGISDETFKMDTLAGTLCH